MVDQILA